MRRLIAITVASIGISADLHGATEAGRFIAVSGQVELLRANRAKVIAAVVDLPVSPGDRVRTGEKSSCRLKMGDGSSLTIQARSGMVISSFIFTPEKKRRNVVFELLSGRLHVLAQKLWSGQASDSLQVRTRSAVAGVRGTEFVVSVGDNGTQVYTLEGAVDVSPPGGGADAAVTVAAGLFTKVAHGERPNPPQPIPPTIMNSLRQEVADGARSADSKESGKESGKMPGKDRVHEPGKGGMSESGRGGVHESGPVDEPIGSDLGDNPLPEGDPGEADSFYIPGGGADGEVPLVPPINQEPPPLTDVNVTIDFGGNAQ